jgi:hypothetical protein
MAIISVKSLNTVVFPTLAFAYHGGTRCYNNGGKMLTDKRLPLVAPNLDYLEEYLPIGVDGILSNGTFYAYDLVNPFTYNANLLSRLFTLGKEIEGLDGIQLPAITVLNKESDVDQLAKHNKTVYFRCPTSLYYQSHVALLQQAWLEYELRETCTGVVTEVVGDDWIKSLIVNTPDKGDIVVYDFKLDAKAIWDRREYVIGGTIEYLSIKGSMAQSGYEYVQFVDRDLVSNDIARL